MPYLYVTNRTTKIQEFLWPNPYGGNESTIIHAGKRAQIGWDALDPGQINMVIAAHKRYGLMAAADLPKDRPFVGLSYEVHDEPLPIDEDASPAHWTHIPSVPASSIRKL